MDAVKERGSRISCVRSASIVCVRYEALDDTLTLSGGYSEEGTVFEQERHSRPPTSLLLALAALPRPGLLQPVAGAPWSLDTFAETLGLKDDVEEVF